MTPRVEVLVPHRNDVPKLREALGALARQTVRPEVCVIDDASTDDTPAVVPAEFPDVRYLRLERNVGFARAVNAGARSSSADVLVLLNNDTVADERFVELLLAAREASGARMVAACLRKPDGRVDSFGIELDPSLVSFEALRGEPYEPARAAGLRLLAPCGGAGAYDREAFLGAGGFDEAIFAYLEDVDLGIRLNLAGERCAVAAEAFAWHHHSAYWGSGTGRKNLRMGTSRGYLLWKYRRNLRARDLLRGAAIDGVVYAGQLVVDRNAGALRGRAQGWRRRRNRPSPAPHPRFRDLPFVDVTVAEALRRRRTARP